MRLLSFLLFLAFVFFAIFARWFFVCEVLKQCEEEVEVIVDERDKTLQLTEDDIVILDGYDQFAFDQRSFDAIMNDNNEAFLDTIVSLMLADSNKRLTITGFYTEQEMDVMAGFSENLGIARAKAVREIISPKGIDESYINIDHGISSDSLLNKPLLFEFYTASAPSEYATTAYTFTNMTFSDANFEVDSYVFTPGAPFILYADSLKNYFDLNEDKSLTIIGHTDSDSTEKYNERLGLNRAKSAKTYFEELGIKNEIKVVSSGEKEPIAPNDSPANKQKNRRVNFVIE